MSRRVHGARGQPLPAAVRAARIAAGPPLLMDPVARVGGKRKRGPDHRTSVLSIFSIQINTQYKPYNRFEQDHLTSRLRLALEKVFREGEFLATFGEWAHSNWAGVSPDQMVNNIEKAKYFYSVETGSPGTKGQRVHAHSQLWISHYDNISLEVAPFMKLLTRTWDALALEADHPEQAPLFMNGPNRKWNIQMHFIRPDKLSHEWWYMNKNLTGIEQHLQRMSSTKGVSFGESLEMAHSQGEL
jgi:hypothetical protein